MNKRVIGRDAGTGKFIPAKVAQRKKAISAIETVKATKKKS
jgi:hypothetical protein